jgi:hypothetical protein
VGDIFEQKLSWWLILDSSIKYRNPTIAYLGDKITEMVVIWQEIGAKYIFLESKL